MPKQLRTRDVQELVAWLEWLKEEGYLSPSARRNVDIGVKHYKGFLK